MLSITKAISKFIQQLTSIPCTGPSGFPFLSSIMVHLVKSWKVSFFSCMRQNAIATTQHDCCIDMSRVAVLFYFHYYFFSSPQLLMTECCLHGVRDCNYCLSVFSKGKVNGQKQYILTEFHFHISKLCKTTIESYSYRTCLLLCNPLSNCPLRTAFSVHTIWSNVHFYIKLTVLPLETITFLF